MIYFSSKNKTVIFTLLLLNLAILPNAFAANGQYGHEEAPKKTLISRDYILDVIGPGSIASLGLGAIGFTLAGKPSLSHDLSLASGLMLGTLTIAKFIHRGCSADHILSTTTQVASLLGQLVLGYYQRHHKLKLDTSRYGKSNLINDVTFFLFTVSLYLYTTLSKNLTSSAIAIL